MLDAVFLFVDCLKKLPGLLFLLSKDLFLYIKNRKWLVFKGWGLHVYVGKFGSGKTCTMVNDAYNKCKKYPGLTVITNLKLVNFPKETKILPLKTPQDILNAPDQTLILIDEIGTIFNSRDFASSKESVPKFLFQHICQCRKKGIMLYGTTQRWNFLDKQLRDITDTVRTCRVHLSHPFSRLGTVHVYDSVDYDRAFQNPLLPCPTITSYAYLQTDEVRARYDTEELIETILTGKYISDEEVMRNRGELDVAFLEMTKKAQRTARNNARRL